MLNTVLRGKIEVLAGMSISLWLQCLQLSWLPKALLLVTRIACQLQSCLMVPSLQAGSVYLL